MNEEKTYSWGGGFASNIPPNYVDEFCFYNKALLENILKEFDISSCSDYNDDKGSKQIINKKTGENND